MDRLAANKGTSSAIEAAARKLEAMNEERRQEGQSVPRSVAELDNLPFHSFSELQEAQQSGRVLVQRFAEPSARYSNLLRFYNHLGE